MQMGDQKIQKPGMSDVKTILARKENSNKYLFYWHIYFNFGYYLGIIPFCSEKNISTGQFEIQENMKQKAIAGIFNLIGLIEKGETFYSFLTSPTAQGIRNIQIIQLALDVAYNFVYIFVFWGRKSSFSAVWQNIQKPEGFFGRWSFSGKEQRTRMIFGLAALFLYVSLAQNRIIATVSKYGWNFDAIISGLAGRARRTFSWDSSSEIPAALLAFTYFSEIYGELMIQFLDLCTYFATFVIWAMVSDFQRTLAENENVGNVLTEYEELKQHSQLINQAVRPFAALTIVSILPYFVLTFTGIAGYQTFIPIVYFFCNLYFLPLAASINGKMDSMKDWLRRNSGKIERCDLTVILNEFIPRSKVGINVLGLFCVNYHFIGSLVGLFLTYIIVALQLQTTPELPAIQDGIFCSYCNLTCFPSA